MASTAFILRLTGLPDTTRAVANLTVNELKRRGCNVEILNVEAQGKGLEEVEIGVPNPAADEHLNVQKFALQTDSSPEQCVTDILSKLEDLQLIDRTAAKDQSYDEDDEAVIRQRLEGLGYL